MKLSQKQKNALKLVALCLIVCSIVFANVYRYQKFKVYYEPFTDETEEKFVYEMSRRIVEIVKKNSSKGMHQIALVHYLMHCKLETLCYSSGACIFAIQCKKPLVFKYVQEPPDSNNELQIVNEVEHPNIVKTYYAFPTDDKKGYFIVMERMDCSLQEYAKYHQKELKNMVRSVAFALKHLHKNKIIHSDLKLANILVKTENGKAIFKICDFGLSHYIYTEEIKPESFGYTPCYFAPETAFEQKFMLSTDIWLLGHTIWYYIKSEDIFDIGRAIDEVKYIEYLSGWHDYLLSDDKLQIVKWCCNRDPSKRPSLDDIIEWCDDKSENYK